jgi:hypothetical protein
MATELLQNAASEYGGVLDESVCPTRQLPRRSEYNYTSPHEIQQLQFRLNDRILILILILIFNNNNRN